ncbi:hypothetical protein [Shinella pollutisoli]|uniref:Uncharacterized protein n=1 Tax=Shinella pollutisoli TaxID=2250594 RepID=A0ABV7DDL3_9HYPH|nr:hypothetical protein [Shinella pollutisoli]
MTPLVALSIACAAFIVGFSAGLGAFALAWQILAPKIPEEDNSGAVEGAYPLDQSGSSSPG